MKIILLNFFGLTFLFLTSCSNSQSNEETPPTADSTIMKNVTEEIEIKITQKWATDPIFKTPESVCYDLEREVLYVANLNMNPREYDNNGSISKLSLNGEVIELDWITGISSPKGMGVYNDKLYVADVKDIVEIDINSGEILNKYNLPDAGMLNDITIDDEGTVYFTDSDVNEVYTLVDGEITVFDSNLKGPNGVYIENDRLLLASMGSSDVVSFNLESKTKEILVENIGAGDGLVPTHKEGYYLVSDWSGEVFLITPENKTESLINTKADTISSADIEFVKSEQLLLVPTFFNNRVVAYTLEIE